MAYLCLVLGLYLGVLIQLIFKEWF